MGLGALTVLSPWVSGAEELTVAVNALAAGALIYAVSALELRSAEIWEDWLNLALGLWLLTAPWTLGYSEVLPLAAGHHVLGALVVLLATLELWQDSQPGRQTISAK